MRKKLVTFKNIMLRSHLSPRSISKVLNFLRAQGWISEKKCGEFKVLVFNWDLIPIEIQKQALVKDPISYIAEKISKHNEAAKFLIQLRSLYEEYGDERIYNTEFSHLTFSRFIERYQYKILHLIQKGVKGQILTENEAALVYTILTFSESKNTFLPCIWKQRFENLVGLDGKIYINSHIVTKEWEEIQKKFMAQKRKPYMQV